MKIQIIIETRKAEQDGNNRSKVWEGELEIKDKDEYLMLISLLGEGQSHPICQVPFSTGVGHYMWIPPDRTIDSLRGEDYG